MPPRRVLRTDADRRTEKLVTGIVIPFVRPDDLDGVSRVNLERWTRQLRDRETQLRQIRKQLEALQSKDSRACPVCGRPVAGRPDKVYCSASCRIRAHRGSKPATPVAVALIESYVVRPEPMYGGKVSFRVDHEPSGWPGQKHSPYDVDGSIGGPCPEALAWKVERTGPRGKRLGYVSYYCGSHLPAEYRQAARKEP
jgi:hypothetical protein